MVGGDGEEKDQRVGIGIRGFCASVLHPCVSQDDPFPHPSLRWSGDFCGTV